MSIKQGVVEAWKADPECDDVGLLRPAAPFPTGLLFFIIEGQTFSARETAVKVFFLLVLYGLGWAINFILTGHRSLLPWVENWEIFSERHRD